MRSVAAGPGLDQRSQRAPAPPTSHRPRNLAIGVTIVLIALGSVVGGVYALGLSSNSSSALHQQSSSYKPPLWLFPGAYATYSAVTASDLVPINITLKIQVVTWNDTSVETLSDFFFHSSIYTAENKSTGWAALPRRSRPSRPTSPSPSRSTPRSSSSAAQPAVASPTSMSAEMRRSRSTSARAPWSR